MNDAALSKLARLSVSAYQAPGDESAGTAATLAMLFESFMPGATTEMIDLGANTGGFSNLGHGIELTRNNIVRVAPRGSFIPSVGEWDIFWRWILSDNSDGAAPWIYKPSVTGGGPGQRNIDWHDTQSFWHLAECIVSRATLSAQAGQEVKLALECQGKSYTKDSGSYPTLTNHSFGPRFLFGDNAISIAGIVGVNTRSVRLTIDHATQNDRYFYGFNSAGPVNTDRMVTLELDIPYGLHPTLTAACAVDGGADGELFFTYGTNTMLVTLPRLRTPAVSVDANVPQEMFMPWRAQAFCTLAASPDTPEITVTLTPAT